MKYALILVLIFISGTFAHAQEDIVGSGRALRFDGVDDYVDLGNIYDNIALPLTISVWIYIDATTKGLTFPIIDSQENSSLYNGFTFVGSTLPHIAITYGDGRGGNNPAFRRSKLAYFKSLTGRWVHITTVMRGATDMDIYLNGYNVGGNYEGTSNFPLNSDSPTEVAKIGHHFSNGIHYRFKGIMDELRIWNRSLSQEEIRDQMCRRLNGSEEGLIGYWNFDETAGDVLQDHSVYQYDGELKGNPTRVFSGAPVGDESVFLYSNDWSGKALMKDNLYVSNVSGNPYGVHIYRVNHMPSLTGGLHVDDLHPGYLGVFLADDAAESSFDVAFTEKTVCEWFQRIDNSGPDWSESEVVSGIENRTEIIQSSAVTDIGMNLGEDLQVCDLSSTVLSSGVDPSGKEFLWSTGERTESIQVNKSGWFSLEVKAECLVERDSVFVMFMRSPESFSLGSDEVLCEFKPKLLQVQHPVAGFEFTWQDNSSDTTFQAEGYGLYWLKISNVCGTRSDSVRFVQADLSGYEFPNVITPNGDPKNEYFILHPLMMGSKFSVFNRWGKQVHVSGSYQNDWNGDDLPSGVYYYTISGECLEEGKGVINISR